MAESITVFGREIAVQSDKMYAVVSVRPADLQTDNGLYVAFGEIRYMTDDWAMAVRSRNDLADQSGPGVSVFVVRTEDSTICLS